MSHKMLGVGFNEQIKRTFMSDEHVPDCTIWHTFRVVKLNLSHKRDTFNVSLVSSAHLTHQQKHISFNKI